MSAETRRLQMLPGILARFPARAGCGLEASVGVTDFDDCAVVPLDSDRDLVIGSDFVRGEGFRLYQQGHLTRRQVGRYLVGANASDLAAMGAAPMGIVVAYRYGESTTDAEFASIMEGVADGCAEMGIPLLGGDSGSYAVPVLSAAAFGICPRGKALLRSRGRSGDRLFVTGPVGLAGAAYEYCGSQAHKAAALTQSDLDALLAPWRCVEPALAQGQALVASGLSVCAIDTSDGLLAAANRIASASGVDVALFEETIPTHPAVLQVAALLKIRPMDLVCGESVDFRLLFSARESVCPTLRQLFAAQEWRLYEIGELRDARALPVAYLEPR